ncbi:2-succinyl-5-enolpyruvyl-6-hydroxy-3-cyclohexene-1-carboxylic-acid synthase [Saccharopolyspora sp. NPDC050389]|uniref:2-succinyl-5-enolpyruvyl-6-hydroxy-3- cyclohexene-1-carboxylic-acid synthase n=1 Tax=Saccharopolyspora sp. NPDC050389 TaxID=3155516 RepID=UPI0033DF8C9F
MNPSTAQATVLVDELIRCGAREAVLCPGSRNAPLAFALHAADAAGRLRLHVRIDERCAGFLAVGLAMRGRRPVPVVCTSGTAAANLHPAVLEASHSGIPLLAITADRPVELRGTGAGQTVDQHRLFGTGVRAAIEFPVAEGSSANARWRSAVDRACAIAVGVRTGDPGPVQVNVPFREPLVPDGREVVTGRAGGAPWNDVLPVVERLRPLPLEVSRTLVVAGQGGAGRIPAGVPVLAEPGSALWQRSLRTAPWLLPAALSGAAPELMPEQVLVLGRPTLHRCVQRLLADDRVDVFAVPAATSCGRNRPMWTDVAGTVHGVGGIPAAWAPPAAFGDAWRRADRAAGAALDEALAAERGVTGPGLAGAVAAGVPAGSMLFAGPSSPIRDIALAARPRADVAVLANRGVAGIDGVVSTAIGAALTHDGPSYALLGDLTFLHDSNGLLLGPDEPRPALTLVVAADSGGSIFSLLEQGAPEHAASFERIFATPVRADLAQLCNAAGVPHTTVADLDQLPEVLRTGGGLRVVEVPVNRADRRALHDRLRRAIETGARAPVPQR